MNFIIKKRNRENGFEYSRNKYKYTKGIYLEQINIIIK